MSGSLPKLCPAKDDIQTECLPPWLVTMAMIFAVYEEIRMKQLKIIILPLLSTVHLHLLMFELQSKLFGKISSPNLFHQQMMNNSPKIISPICYPFKAPPKTKSAKTTYSSKSLLKKLVAFCQPGFLCQMWPSLISGRGQNRPDCQGKQGRKDLLLLLLLAKRKHLNKRNFFQHASIRFLLTLDKRMWQRGEREGREVVEEKKRKLQDSFPLLGHGPLRQKCSNRDVCFCSGKVAYSTENLANKIDLFLLEL